MKQTNRSGQGHLRLDVFHVAVELFREVEALARELPTGSSDLKDQLRRAAGAIVRNIAEGANRWHARDKAARFCIASGECGECDATLLMAEVAGLANPARVRRLRSLTDRIAAMLVGLIRRQREGP
jgi:four helix bundle protein